MSPVGQRMLFSTDGEQTALLEKDARSESSWPNRRRPSFCSRKIERSKKSRKSCSTLHRSSRLVFYIA